MKNIAGCICILLVSVFFLISCNGPDATTLSGDNIICFGDSLTYGTGASRDRSYPAQLSKMIGRPIINTGVPGDTTSRALERLAEDVLDQSPRIVLITLGGNDLKNGVNKNTAFKNLKAIIEAIQAEGGLVILGGIKFVVLDKGYGEMYKNLAKETGIILVPNVLKGLIGRDKYMSDPIHPNGDGYAIMAERFYAAMKPYVENPN